MTGTMRHIAVILAAGLLVGGVAAGEPGDDARQPVRYPGDIVSQLRLKLKLLRTLDNSSVVEAVSHARQQWEGLTPDQRQRYRDQARAFLRENPERQAELLRHYDKLIRMTPERRAAYRYRAAWLKAVTDWLRAHDPERIEALRRMTPTQRAEQFVALRDRLVAEGEIELPPPPSAATRPATDRTTRPSTRSGDRAASGR
ncbi:MAG: DUF3106 domain-containing protein [Planctomycetota bacterium]